MSSTEELLRTEGLTKIFPGVVAVDNVDFDVRVGEIHALVGENGAGKSTLIKILGGVYLPDGGKILLDGREVAFSSTHQSQVSKISVIFQEFNLVPDLTIAGSVASIAPVGTVSQGVVSYVVKISFATQDTRIKPGMSVSAQINTQVKTDALAIPNSAVHTSANGGSYVLAFDPPLVASSTAVANKGIPSTLTPQQTPVTVGINNTTMTEVTSGISAGQQVVVRSITSSATVTKSAAVTATSRTGGGSFGGPGAAGSARAIGL